MVEAFLSQDIEDQITNTLGTKVVEFIEKNPRRFYLTVKPVDLPECVKILVKELWLRMSTATAVDTRECIEILYHFSHDKSGKMFTLKVKLEDKSKPEIRSIATIFKGAEWIEREIAELFGVNFIGHPDMKRLLLSSDWPEGKYPLRRDSK
ncbi:MAG: NADH-quinone oxidoreductase subunit C [Elusimicrobiota bacterium]